MVFIVKVKITVYTIHCAAEDMHVGLTLCVVHFEKLVLHIEEIHGCENGECKPLIGASMASSFLLFVLIIAAGEIHPVAGVINSMAREIHSDEIAVSSVDGVAFINFKLENLEGKVENIDFDFNTIVARVIPNWLHSSRFAVCIIVLADRLWFTQPI